MPDPVFQWRYGGPWGDVFISLDQVAVAYLPDALFPDRSKGKYYVRLKVGTELYLDTYRPGMTSFPEEHIRFQAELMEFRNKKEEAKNAGS